MALSPAPIQVRLFGCLTLFMLLPGWLLETLVLGRRSERAAPERFLMMLGLGYCFTLALGGVLTLLALIGLTRPVHSWHITLVASGLVLALLGALPRARAQLDIPSARPGRLMLAVVVLAGFLRLWDLGWSEFQGDEARVLLRAMAAIQGVPDALLAHRKVPGEILIDVPFYGQLGAVTELVGRLPFALSGVAAVATFTILARELCGARAALVAGLLMAVNGYFVAFGRILQYESPAFLLGSLGLLCAVRFGRGERPSVGLALAGSLLLCCAGLLALGAMFLALPAAWFVGARLAALERNRARMAALWLWPGVLAALAALLVVAVEVVGQRSGGVLSYLGPRLGGGRPYSNWGELLTSANHYLSTPYLVVTLGCGAMAVLTIVVAQLRRKASRRAVIALALALATLGVSWARPAAIALAVSLAVLGLALSSPRVSLTDRAVLSWAAAPLLVHGFLIRVPGTHWREAFPGLILITATMLAAVVPAGPLLRLAYGVGVVGMLALTHFSWTTLIQRWPEYQMSYPDQRHWLDWTNATGRGIGGVFGVSHHHGWKTLAIMQEQGQLPTSYVTNESPAIAAWYLRRAQGCPMPPAAIFRAPRAPQDRNLTGPVPLPTGYVAALEITVDGHRAITVLQPPDVAPVQAPSLASESEALFDAARTSPWVPVGTFYQPDVGAAARLECARQGA